jgi:hypothetical protein
MNITILIGNPLFTTILTTLLYLLLLLLLRFNLGRLEDIFWAAAHAASFLLM